MRVRVTLKPAIKVTTQFTIRVPVRVAASRS